MKNRKNNIGFLYTYINNAMQGYAMANFVAFRWNISSSTNFEIMRSAQL